jgi:anti-anti-sigma factor
MFTALSPVTASSQLHIDATYPSPDTARADVVGEVDLSTAQDLRDRLLNMLQAQPPVALTVDLSRVTFLDCTGISALISARNVAIQRDCQMWVTSPPPIVHRILDLTGSLSILTAPPDQAQRTAMNPSPGSGSSTTRTVHSEWLVAA